MGRQTCFARLLCLICFGSTNNQWSTLLQARHGLDRSRQHCRCSCFDNKPWGTPSSEACVLGFATGHFDWAALMHWVPAGSSLRGFSAVSLHAPGLCLFKCKCPCHNRKMDVEIAAGGLWCNRKIPQQLGNEGLQPVLVPHLVDYTCCWSTTPELEFPYFSATVLQTGYMPGPWV